MIVCYTASQIAQCKISTVSKNTNQSAKPLWLVFSLSNLWIIVSSFVTLPSSQNQPLSAVVKGCQYILLAHLLHIACSFTASRRLTARTPSGSQTAPTLHGPHCTPGPPRSPSPRKTPVSPPPNGPTDTAFFRRAHGPTAPPG